MADNQQPIIPAFNIVELNTSQVSQESSEPADDDEFYKAVNNRKRLLVLGAIVATILVLLLAVVGFVVIALVAQNKEDGHSKLPHCELMQDHEQFQGRRLLWSEDGRAIADLYGYFRYTFSDPDPTRDAYLEFRFESIRVEANESGQQVMILSSDCAELGFRFAASNSSGRRAVESVQVKLAIPHGGDTQCAIEPDKPGFSADEGYHYECDDESSYYEHDYSCDIHVIDEHGEMLNYRVVRLYIPHFEFEVDGDPEKTKRGEFSSEPASCM